MKINSFVKPLLFSILFFFVCNQLFAQSNFIKINISALNTDKGNVLVALFNTSNGFPEDASKAYKTAKSKAVKGTKSIILTDIPPGNYAIAIFHDANDDGKMNKNMLGIPKEGYGVSNNVKNLMSAPEFKAAKFTHQQSTELSIMINY
jgi:uncharacterized protein (DUF2141 family)